jgi:hypothetical protein
MLLQMYRTYFVQIMLAGAPFQTNLESGEFNILKEVTQKRFNEDAVMDVNKPESLKQLSPVIINISQNPSQDPSLSGQVDLGNIGAKNQDLTAVSAILPKIESLISKAKFVPDTSSDGQGKNNQKNEGEIIGNNINKFRMLKQEQDFKAA